MELTLAAKQIIDDLQLLLEKINDTDYQKPIPVLNNATIGQHVRHILEFFLCLNEGYFRGIVNYDNRMRNKQIEESRNYASAQIDKILDAIRVYHLEHDLLLEMSYDEYGESGVQVKTNYHRELAYNIEHAVHHMALIRIGLRDAAPYIRVPQNFGVAVSTIRHQELQAAVNA